MALKALNSVISTNYAKVSTDPVLAGDIVAFSTTSGANSVNPPGVYRARRTDTYALYRAYVVGVCADDALGTNPYGELPTMINNDPAGSNFLNGSVFQSYTAGFYVGSKRYISDFKDESIDVVTNLTAGIPTYSQRGVSVYTTPSSQFVTDRWAPAQASSTTNDQGGAWVPAVGDLVTFGSTNGQTPSAANVSQTPNLSTYSTTSYNAGLLVKDANNTAYSIPIGRVDYYDSGSGLLYWTLV